MERKPATRPATRSSSAVQQVQRAPQASSYRRRSSVASNEEQVSDTKETRDVAAVRRSPRRPSKSRKTKKSPSTGSTSENRDQPSEGQCCCSNRICNCNCKSGGSAVESLGVATDAIRRDVALKTSAKGTYEADEDTMSQQRDDDDWSPRDADRKRVSKCTPRQVIGKIVEYGIVAGIVVAIFCVVNKKMEASK